MSSDEAILPQAFRHFAERGYEGASMREIARMTDVSHNLLHLRFGTKEELWRRAVRFRIAQSSAEVWAAFERVDLPPEARLKLLVNTYCVAAASEADIHLLVTMESMRDSWRLDFLVEHFIGPFERELEPMLAAVARPGNEPISAVAFMSLLVNGAGTYFAARPLMSRASRAGSRPEETPAEMRIRFETALLHAARG